MAEILHKLELVYGTMASFNILMQKFYKEQWGKTGKVPGYVTHKEGVLNAAQQEYAMMLSMTEVQKHLRDCFFHRLHKQLHDSMCYLYDDPRIMYPQLMTVGSKAKSKQEERPREGVQVRMA